MTHKPVAPEATAESLLFCCHYKQLLHPPSDLSSLLPRIRYGLCHVFTWFFSVQVQFAEQVFLSLTVHQEGSSFPRVLYIKSCENQLGSICASLSTWDLVVLPDFFKNWFPF